jgi:hypothetical protein
MENIFGVGATHVPYLMSAPENMLRLREQVCKMVERLEGRPFQDPPEAVAQLGKNPQSVATEHHQLHWKAFERLGIDGEQANFTMPALSPVVLLASTSTPTPTPTPTPTRTPRRG